MSPKVLVLHAYSAHNRGDGLLVDRLIALLREAFGADVQLEMVASYPESFSYLGIPVYCAKPGRSGWNREYLRVLQRLNSYDLIVGVGGGCLRAGHPVEMAKTLLVMGPQILAAGAARTPSVYLPQSIGPFRCGSVYLFRYLVGRITSYMLRDARSLAEIRQSNCVRLPDLALTSPEFTQAVRGFSEADVDDTVVLTARAVHGSLPPGVRELYARLRQSDIPVVGFIQSAVGGNNDTEVQRSLTGAAEITPAEYLRKGPEYPARVVVAVRLHAALMALQAGHYVIHLAYERKGFAAFEDAGLSPLVHNVNTFDPECVLEQVKTLLTDESARAEYRKKVRERCDYLERCHAEMIEILQASVSQQ